MLIRDPYLHSAQKISRPFSANRTQGQPDYSYIKQQNENLKTKVNMYERDMSTLRRAANDRQQMSQKLLNLHSVDAEYHEAMKLRNLDLNNRLGDLALQRELVEQHHLEQKYRSTSDRDILLRRYEQQAEEMLSLKRSLTVAMEHKQQLQSELSHLAFVLQKETSKLTLQLREQAIRMENMERTYKNIISTKEQEVSSLHQRLKNYEDQNRRLSQLNRTLQIIKNDRINNLSRIPDMESNGKSRYGGRSIQKQNHNPNCNIVEQQLETEKQKNYRLQQQIQKLNNQKRNRSRSRQKQPHCDKMELAKTEGLIGSIVTLRNGINKQVFDVFFKSIREGQKRRQNSLVIFITNWKNLDIQRLQPYIESYLQTRDGLKEIALNDISKGHALKVKIEECIPLHVGSRKGRSKINEWILSTIQFTKQQRETGKKSLNNLLLFLFRLLTIQYRICYPMQGKSFTVDNDVRNELLHQTVKAVRLLLEHKH